MVNFKGESGILFKAYLLRTNWKSFGQLRLFPLSLTDSRYYLLNFQNHARIGDKLRQKLFYIFDGFVAISQSCGRKILQQFFTINAWRVTLVGLRKFFALRTSN